MHGEGILKGGKGRLGGKRVMRGKFTQRGPRTYGQVRLEEKKCTREIICGVSFRESKSQKGRAMVLLPRD